MMRNLVKKTRNRKGFTLIELIIVVAILGILAAVAVPSYAGYQDSARLRTNETNAKTIENAAKVYQAVEGKLPLLPGDIDDPAFLGTTPPVPLETDSTTGDFDAAIGDTFIIDDTTGRVTVGDADTTHDALSGAAVAK